VVERRPRRAQLGHRDELLFGLYEGVPLTERGADYGLVLPDKISIFQDPLEQAFQKDEDLVEEIRKTVLHELAHYFGMTDEDLERLGLD
jgi:predicted Zn-dependent protease with MMP-like domain